MCFGGLSRPAITQQKQQDTPHMDPKTKKTEQEQNSSDSGNRSRCKVQQTTVDNF